MKLHISHITSRFLMVILAGLLGALGAVQAFDLDAYAPHSMLAEGRWVKVSVKESGVYLISNQTLSRYGLSAANAYVYGYGGAMHNNNALTKANYTDDLTPVAVERTSRGLVFYAQGIERLEAVGNNHYVYFQDQYTPAAYYFVSNVAPADEPTIATTGTAGATDPATKFVQVEQHEVDAVSPGETGSLLVGESFKNAQRQNFSFAMPGNDDNWVWIECAFVSKTYNSRAYLDLTANGKALWHDSISPTSSSSYYHGQYIRMQRGVTFDQPADKIDISVSLSAPVTIQNAWLDYLTINYDRALRLDRQPLPFILTNPQGLLAGATQTTRIWDVTNPRAPMAQATDVQDGGAAWTSDYTGLRQYVAWDDNSMLPSPTVVGEVRNQDLHGLATVPNMVIFAPAPMREHAQRLANMHASGIAGDTLDVLVVTPEEVYNEFGSGAQTPHALRGFLKMLYDRGREADNGGLKYALMMGRPTYDHRGLTAGNAKYPTVGVPTFIVGHKGVSLSDNSSYCTDDFFAILSDGAYTRPTSEKFTIAVGRIPVSDAAEAKAVVDKTIDYVQNSKKTGWKNQLVALADDGDNGIHVKQMEALLNKIENTAANPLVLNKIYLSAYPLTNGNTVEARQEMYRLLDEGQAWWMFIGHASAHSWTEEGMLKYNDLNSLYLRKLPMMYAATCDFLRWDAAETSGAERLYTNRNGGIIGAISAVRPVFINLNGKFSEAMGQQISRRDANGRLLTIGQQYVNAKNNGLLQGDDNKLRYVLMGDPALRVATPDNLVTLDAIDGEAVTPDSQVTLAALQQATLEGQVLDPHGNPLTDFNGVVDVTIYDAENTVTAHDHADYDCIINFERHGERIFAGSGLARDGQYKVNVSMPGEVADNFRPAMVSLYARSTAYGDVTEAVGLNKDIYVYGFDDTVPMDTIPPVIERIYLNTPEFTSGGTVDCSPMLIANITDNVGINLSSSGLGHQMQILLDGARTYNDVAMYYTPLEDGTPGGTIAYPLTDLVPGAHTLRLRVWDTSSNAATEELTFVASPTLAPNLLDVYTDASPAHDTAGFYVVTDRPDAMARVTITVYDLMGRALWGQSVEGRNDMGVSVPVIWDLTNYAGQRVPRGIYIYRATVTTDGGQTYASQAKKIAVAAP